MKRRALERNNNKKELRKPKAGAERMSELSGEGLQSTPGDALSVDANRWWKEKLYIDIHLYLKAVEHGPWRSSRLTISIPYYLLFLVCRSLFISLKECS